MSETTKEVYIISESKNLILKGLFSVLVILHHTANFNSPILDRFVSALGPLAVGGFLFLSGYGIMLKFHKHGASYIKQLLLRRIPHLIFIIVFTNFIYMFLYLITTGESLSFLNVLTSLLYITPSKHFIAFYSWIYFIENLIIYYLFFVLTALVLKKVKTADKSKLIALTYLALIVAVYIAITIIMQKILNMRALLCFPLGLITFAYKDKIANLKQNTKLIIEISAFVLVILLTFFASNKIVVELILPVLFCLAIIASRRQKAAVPFSYLGKISLYTYLFQGIFHTVFKTYMPNLPNFLFVLMVLMSTILLAAVIHFLKTRHKRSAIAAEKP